IKKDERLKHTKILAITGYATPENKKKILECGADDFLAKPFEIDELISSIKKLLNIEKTTEEK
ncbi:MAG: response regulator, partial [Endomicrobiia bacterium]